MLQTESGLADPTKCKNSCSASLVESIGPCPCLSVSLFVCMNTLILVINKAKHIKFGIKVFVYHTQTKLTSNIECHPQRPCNQ